MIGTVKILGEALKRTLKSLVVLAPAVALIGGVAGAIMWFANAWAGENIMAIRGVVKSLADLLGQEYNPYGPITSQTVLIYGYVLSQPFYLLWGCLAYPVLDALSIYCWRVTGRGELPSPGNALNFAIGRYKRMVGPHAKAFITITLGMIIIVPGVLFGLQYAFVDAITATDDKSQAPLQRSQKLTAGRRGRLALSWIPYALWYVPYQIVFLQEAWAAPTVWQAVGWGLLDMSLLAVMEMAMYGFYEQRIEDARKARERREEAERPAEDTEATEVAQLEDEGDTEVVPQVEAPGKVGDEVVEPDSEEDSQA